MKTTAYAGTMGEWGRMAVLLAAMAVGLFGVLLLASGTARAHDHQIPNTVLKKGAKELQAGISVFESNWERPSGDLCEHVSTFYRTRFPETDAVAAGSELRVRISKVQRPDSFVVAAYQTVDENGDPSGEARMLRRTLERVVKDGKTVAWDAVFFVNRKSRDYYLITEGHWQDREGCGGDQYAYWSYHVKTRA